MVATIHEVYHPTSAHQNFKPKQHTVSNYLRIFLKLQLIYLLFLLLFLPPQLHCYLDASIQVCMAKGVHIHRYK